MRKRLNKKLYQRRVKRMESFIGRAKEADLPSPWMSVGLSAIHFSLAATKLQFNQKKVGHEKKTR